jgi:hypothetical protein
MGHQRRRRRHRSRSLRLEHSGPGLDRSALPRAIYARVWTAVTAGTPAVAPTMASATVMPTSSASARGVPDFLLPPAPRGRCRPWSARGTTDRNALPASLSRSGGGPRTPATNRAGNSHRALGNGDASVCFRNRRRSGSSGATQVRLPTARQSTPVVWDVSDNCAQAGRGDGRPTDVHPVAEPGTSLSRVKRRLFEVVGDRAPHEGPRAVLGGALDALRYGLGAPLSDGCRGACPASVGPISVASGRSAPVRARGGRALPLPGHPPRPSPPPATGVQTGSRAPPVTLLLQVKSAACGAAHRLASGCGRTHTPDTQIELHRPGASWRRSTRLR